MRAWSVGAFGEAVDRFAKDVFRNEQWFREVLRPVHSPRVQRIGGLSQRQQEAAVNEDHCLLGKP